MSNIQKQHKISPAIAWLTIQKFIIFYCPLDGEHTRFHVGTAVAQFIFLSVQTVLLIDSWENQDAIDVHHGTAMMDTIFRLREKYNLHMKVERYLLDDEIPDSDKKYINE